MERGNDYVGMDAENDISERVSMLEELWFRTENRAIGLNLSRGYAKLGDAEREAFWKAVFHGTIKPGEKADGSKEHA